MAGEVMRRGLVPARGASLGVGMNLKTSETTASF